MFLMPLMQGKYYNQLAREADEKSQQEILNMKLYLFSNMDFSLYLPHLSSSFIVINFVITH